MPKNSATHLDLLNSKDIYSATTSGVTRYTFRCFCCLFWKLRHLIDRTSPSISSEIYIGRFGLRFGSEHSQIVTPYCYQRRQTTRKMRSKSSAKSWLVLCFACLLPVLSQSRRAPNNYRSASHLASRRSSNTKLGRRMMAGFAVTNPLSVRHRRRTPNNHKAVQMVIKTHQHYAAPYNHQKPTTPHVLTRNGTTLVYSNKKFLQSTERHYRYASVDSAVMVPGLTITAAPATATAGITAVVPQTATFPSSRLQTWWRDMDTVAFLTYLANVIAVNLPVLLLPAAATQLASSSGTSISTTSLIASMTAIASLGGAVGKFTNGFVVSHGTWSPQSCSLGYMIGLAVCSLCFGTICHTPLRMALAYAGMEFFASMQWTALAVMLSNNNNSGTNLARSMTKLGLSSTLGQVSCKLLGTTLLSLTCWRMASKVGACVALLGAIVMKCHARREESMVRVMSSTMAPNHVMRPTKTTGNIALSRGRSSAFRSILASFRDVLGRPLFWMVGLAHAAAYLARSSDRILGAFFQHSTALPQSICGGLTLSVTLGLVHGLIRGDRNFATDDHAHKTKFLSRLYLTAVVSAMGLAGLSHYGPSLISSKTITALLACALSGAMASSLSFQYFQVPAMVAERFGHNKAVCISFLDGMGFLLAAPVWATTSRMVPSMGWVSAWTLLAGLFGAGGILMMQAFPVFGKNPQGAALKDTTR